MCVHQPAAGGCAITRTADGLPAVDRRRWRRVQRSWAWPGGDRKQTFADSGLRTRAFQKHGYASCEIMGVT